ncbi:MAG: MFS transporter [Proteobacteria bacterium]|nr:MFS transporter [Pseudomonadota bacterium]
MTTSWLRLLLIYAIGVIAAGQLGVVPPLVPALQAELGLSLATAGSVVSLVTLVGGLLGVPAGAFAERIGHARAFRLGLLVMALAAGLCAVAQGAPLLLAARTLAGVGYLLVVVAGPSLMAMLAEPHRQPVALSLWGTFVPVGIALAGLATAGFAHAGWRTIFAVDAILLAAALLAALRLRSPPSHATDWRMPPGSLRAALPLALSFFCFALLFLALAGMLPAYLVERRDMTAAAAGQTVALATALGIAGSFAAAWLMHRGATTGRLIAFGLAASTVAAVLAFRPEFGLSLSITGFALSFAIGGLVPSAAFAAVPRLAPGPRSIGPINGLLAQAGSLGSLAGPPVLALWVEFTGWVYAPLLLLVVAAVGVVAVNALQKRQSKVRSA